MRYARNIQRHFVDLGVVELFDITEHAHVLGSDEVDRDAFSPKATSTTDAMDVVLTI